MPDQPVKVGQLTYRCQCCPGGVPGHFEHRSSMCGGFQGRYTEGGHDLPPGWTVELYVVFHCGSPGGFDSRKSEAELDAETRAYRARRALERG